MEEECLVDVEEAAGMGAKGNFEPSRGGGGSGRDGLRARSLPSWLLFRSRHKRLVSDGCVHMSCSTRRTGRGSDVGEGFPVGTGQERHSLPQSPFRPGQAPSLAGVPGALMHLPGPALRAEASRSSVATLGVSGPRLALCLASEQGDRGTVLVIVRRIHSVPLNPLDGNRFLPFQNSGVCVNLLRTRRWLTSSQQPCSELPGFSTC